MQIGVFADVHDHVDHMRHAVREFNAAGCELVLLAGDLCSPLVVPPLRKLHGQLVVCFGDNDGNKTGIRGGMRICGTIGEPPLGIETRDGTRILLTHQLDRLKGLVDGADVIVFAHTHRPSIATDAQGRLFVNPGETSGWNFRKPSIAVIDSETRQARLVHLPPMPEPVAIESF